MRVLALPALAAFLFAGASLGQGVTERDLQATANRPGDWIATGRDYAETHYSPLRDLNTANVRRLGLGMVRRHGDAAWTRSDAYCSERRDVRHRKLERRVRVQCGHRKADLAMG